MLRLPEELRSAFKEPLGPVYTDADALLAEAGAPLVAVGDVVTYHLLRADRAPDVAVVDGLTEREAVDDDVAAVVEREWAAGVAHRFDVENPAATLSGDLLVAIRDAVDADGPSAVVVDGEEDLATLAAVVAAPDGASVVYGQPGEGMVHVRVTPEARDTCRELLSRMDGDTERALSLLTD